MFEEAHNLGQIFNDSVLKYSEMSVKQTNKGKGVSIVLKIHYIDFLLSVCSLLN